MTQIFISYASEDAAWAKVLASALEAHGWSVWWDRKIPVGKSFHQVIEEAIDGANCIVVIWSKHSVVSDWVRNEAEEGKRRNVLVPVWMDNSKIPLGFRHLQAADLSEWEPDSSSVEFAGLLDSIKGILGVPSETHLSASSKHAQQPSPGAATGAPQRSGHRPAKKRTVERQPDASGMYPLTPSKALAAVVGPAPLVRTEVTKKIWDYIKKNELQDSINKRVINADAKLRRIFGKEQVTMFEMTKLLNNHLKRAE